MCEELAKLPERQAAAFWMRSIEEMSYSAIAEQMDIGANEVGVLVHRARVRLRILLARWNPRCNREC